MLNPSTAESHSGESRWQGRHRERNGLQDLVLVSNLVGLMGNTADLSLMSAFLLRPDSTVAYLEFSSYKGDVDLFKDYSGDGKLEFACVKKFVTDRGKFYTMNLFSFVGGRPRNVTVNAKPSATHRHVQRSLVSSFRSKT